MYTLLIHTPPFLAKDANFRTLFHSDTKNEIINSKFVQQQRKMVFLISSSASKHVLFALGVDPTARDAGEGGNSDLVSQAMPFTVSCETSNYPCSLATQVYYRQASQEVKQMLWSLPLKFASHSSIAQRK